MQVAVLSRWNAKRVLTAALALCVALAGLSLLLHYEPVYDSWGWLTWGRESAHLDLDTSAGPSWKPLPVLITTPLSVFGDAAPDLWLLVARATGFAVPVLAAFLAWRLCRSERPGARAMAALVAGAATLLLRNDLTPWVRQLSAGLSEPMLSALVLAAIGLALARRPRLALLAAALACLIRPEAWPFAALYGWQQWRQGAVSARAVGAGVIVVLALWFVPDQLGSNNPLEGADRARAGSSGFGAAFDTLGRGFKLPLLGIWVAALACFADPALRRRGELRALGLGVLAWILMDAALAVVGYAGLARFMEPAAAVLCVLAGVGFAALLERASPPAPIAAAVLVAGLLLAGAGIRAASLDDQLRVTRERSDMVADLREVVEESGHAEIRGCRPIGITDGLNTASLAWDLELPMSEVREANRAPQAGTWILAPDSTERLREKAREAGRLLVSDRGWSVYEISGPRCG